MSAVTELKIVSNNEVSLGDAQWGCLSKIANEYSNVNLGRISNSSTFNDETWKNKSTLESDLNWDIRFLGKKRLGSFSEDQYPLKLLCKITLYTEVCLMGKAISLFTQCQSFIGYFGDYLKSKNILTGNKGDEFKSLSSLTDEDIRFMVQTHLAKTEGKINYSPFEFLQKIKDLPAEALASAPFLSIVTVLPWEKDGVTPRKWIDQQKAVLEIETIKKNYKPLPNETVGEVVKNAMTWIDQKEMLIDISRIIRAAGDISNEITRSSVSVEIINKYGEEVKKLLEVRKYDKRYTVEYGWLTQFVRLAQSASIWILMLTTGLRNVDLRKLTINCCKPTGRSNVLNYLITDIKKTGQAGYILPVPNQTRDAIEILQNLKFDFECDFLLTKSSKTISKERAEQSAMHTHEALNSFILEFLDHYDIDRIVDENDKTEVTAHCIRATLAGWIGANSHMAILIIRKLFGHTNALMPDAYLSHNPIIIKQRQENITKAQESLAEDMAEGMINGKLSGTKGKQMLRGAKYAEDEWQREGESLTEMDMHVTLKERLKELLLQRITGGQVFAMLTPMGVVCMRNCNDTSDTPCAKQANHEKRKDQNVSKEITDALGTLPNPGHCVGKDCSDALLGEKWSRPLLETFEYYINYLKGMGNQDIDMKLEAEVFVKEYGPLLQEIYDEEDCFG